LSPDLDAAMVDEALRTLNGGFAGVGELAAYHDGWTRDNLARLDPVCRLSREKGTPVLIHVNEPVGHVYPGKINVDAAGLVDMIAAHPNTTFILAHWGGGLMFYALMPEIKKVFANTYFDTAASPFLYSSDVFDIALRTAGADRIVFGTDYPLLGRRRYDMQLDEAGIKSPDREKILGGNMDGLLERGRRDGKE
ncbi:MAG: amidohydrolase family protein, partial [Pseudomonadota bacterium]